MQIVSSCPISARQKTPYKILGWLGKSSEKHLVDRSRRSEVDSHLLPPPPAPPPRNQAPPCHPACHPPTRPPCPCPPPGFALASTPGGRCPLLPEVSAFSLLSAELFLREGKNFRFESFQLDGCIGHWTNLKSLTGHQAESLEFR